MVSAYVTACAAVDRLWIKPLVGRDSSRLWTVTGVLLPSCRTFGLGPNILLGNGIFSLFRHLSEQDVNKNVANRPQSPRIPSGFWLSRWTWPPYLPYALFHEVESCPHVFGVEGPKPHDPLLVPAAWIFPYSSIRCVDCVASGFRRRRAASKRFPRRASA